MKQERIIYEEQPFYSLERVPKPLENGFGTRYLVKLAVAGAVATVARLKASCHLQVHVQYCLHNVCCLMYGMCTPPLIILWTTSKIAYKATLVGLSKPRQTMNPVKGVCHFTCSFDETLKRGKLALT